MEKLIEGLQLEKLGSINKKGEQTVAGFTIHWSPSKKIWLVSYGRNAAITNKKVGTGYSVIEALVEFIEKNEMV